MSRGTKTILLAMLVAVLLWVVGTYLVGMSYIEYTTSQGVVDMSQPREISKAVKDPTFTAILSWRSVQIQGLYASALLPILFAIVGIIATVLIRIRR
ncbi:MAG: hypothetical protein JAZ17_20780 [Candidatus Thiodiazotropha endolucinida]|nr:hypothetical protein [Candidatus Thiodiazotropha endolucinida]